MPPWHGSVLGWLLLMALFGPEAAGLPFCLPFFAWVLGAWLLAAGLVRELGEKMLEPNEDMQVGPRQLYLL